jgi:DNA-binding LytR/AlgR family response regulator
LALFGLITEGPFEFDFCRVGMNASAGAEATEVKLENGSPSSLATSSDLPTLPANGLQLLHRSKPPTRLKAETTLVAASAVAWRAFRLSALSGIPTAIRTQVIATAAAVAKAFAQG